MPEETLAIVEAPVETTVTPKDKKEAAFLMPAKEEIAGYTCHAFSKARKGFVLATGNELMNMDRHLTAYKSAHPDWRTEIDTRSIDAARAIQVEEEEKIVDVDQKGAAVAKANSEYEAGLEWTLVELAVPDFAFHMTALAYLCCQSAVEISKLVGKPREYFHAQVATWADEMPDAVWDKLTFRAFQELIESNIGNDYKVKEEKSGTPGAPATKN